MPGLTRRSKAPLVPFRPVSAFCRKSRCRRGVKRFGVFQPRNPSRFSEKFLIDDDKSPVRLGDSRGKAPNWDTFCAPPFGSRTAILVENLPHDGTTFCPRRPFGPDEQDFTLDI